MGWASRNKEGKQPPGGGDGRGGPSGFGKATLFTDVHPQHRINARFFIQMFEMLSETTLSLDERQHVMHRSLLLVVNKLATMWRHLARYRRIETRLLEAARKKPLQRVEPVSHDPDLYRACDDFLIQLRDGLNRLWRFPADFFPVWPLTGLPESVDGALEAIGKMTDERQAKFVDPIVKALENHRPWIEEVLSQTTKGLDPLLFQVFVSGPESGDSREVVPMWTQTERVSATMGALWESFYVLTELVVGAAIAFRLRPGVGLLYRFRPLASDESSWVLTKPEPRRCIGFVAPPPRATRGPKPKSANDTETAGASHPTSRWPSNGFGEAPFTAKMKPGLLSRI